MSNAEGWGGMWNVSQRFRGPYRVAALGMLGVGLVLSACAGADEGGSTVTGEGGSTESRIVVVQASDVNAIQPDVEPVLPSLRIGVEILDAATKYAYESGSLVIKPNLATEWSQVDAKTWEFKVRPDVEFTNGEPLNAQTFKNSLDVYRDNAGPGAFVMSGIEDITVVDDLTFHVTTVSDDLASLPSKLSFLFAYPPNYYDEVGKEGFGNAPIGTGPYQVDSWDKGVALNLIANPDYWGGEPSIKAITYRFVSDPATGVSMLETGEADFVADLPPSIAARLDGISSARSEVIRSARRLFYFFNVHAEPADDVRVRQAINYAIDRESIIDGLFDGHAYPLKGIWLEGEMGYTDSFAGYEYDPEKARELLAEAGYGDGLTIDINFTIANTPLDKETSEAVQANLRDVGITANLQGGPINAISTLYSSNEAVDLNQWNYAPIYPDPSFLTNVASFSTGSLYGVYSTDPTTDEMTADALATTDPVLRQAKYEEIERYVISEQAYWAPLYALEDRYGVSKRLNWSPRPDQQFYFENATLGASD